MKVPEGKHLGVLCKRGHNWNRTGYSLRYNKSHACVVCSIKRPQKKRIEARQENREKQKKIRRKERCGENANCVCQDAE